MLEYDLIEAWAAWVKTNVDVVDPGRHGQASRALVAGVSNNEGQIWAPVETLIVTWFRGALRRDLEARLERHQSLFHSHCQLRLQWHLESEHN
jgi:hypothetical protein